MFKRKNGATNVRYFQKKASQAFTNGGLVSLDTNGYLIPANATSTGHLGVVLVSVASTDADYAETTRLPVDCVSPTDVLVADVSAGTVAQTAVGAYYDLDSTGAKVDLSGTTTKQVFVTDINTATSEVEVIVNSTAGVDETGA